MRFTQKVFFVMLALMVFAMQLTTAIVYLSSYNSAAASEKARSEMEQYAVVLGLVQASDEYELGKRLSGFIDAYASTGARLELLKSENYGSRTIEYVTDESGQSIVVTSGLPTPFSQYALRYQRNLMSMQLSLNQLARRLALIHFGVSVLFACLSFFCLQGLTGPLRRLSANMGRFARGEKPVHYGIQGRDELAELSRRFYGMTVSIQKQNDTLARESERRQRFIDDLSHELRTPTTSISGYATLLRDARLTPEQQTDALDFLIHESRRLHDMADKLLRLTILEAEPIDREKVDAHKLLEQVEFAIRPVSQSAGVGVRYSVECEALLGDAALLQSLIQNLLQNAIRASDAGGVVTLSLRGDPAELIVADRGVGMTKGQMRHILEPFYTVDKARSRQQGGAGLGLSICAAIVRAHGAKMVIHSTPGKGTSIRVQFTNQIQHGADMDTEPTVSFSQGEIPEEEEKIMKRRRKKKLPGQVILWTCAALLVLSLLAAPKLLTWMPNPLSPARATPGGEVDSLIPLPVADERFSSFSTSRDISGEENDRYLAISEGFQAQLREQLDAEPEAYAFIIAEYARQKGVKPISTEPAEDGLYIVYSESSVTLMVPDRALTDDELWEIIRFTYETLDPAMDALFYTQGFDGGERPYTENERERLNRLTEKYENEGLRPQSPIPTAPTEDGFYHDPSIDPFHVSLPRTYELSDEQLLQIIDLTHRAAQSIHEKYVEPVQSQKSDEEWIAIALELFKEKDLPFEEKENGYWTVEFTLGWETSGSPDALLMYGDEEDHLSLDYCYSILFDPADGNRIETIRMPKYKEYAVGTSMLSTNLSEQEWRDVLSRQEWLDIAERYAREHIYDQTMPLTITVNENTPHDPVEPWDDDDVVPEHDAVYIEVMVTKDDGGEVMIDINPDTMSVNGYAID